MKKRSGNLKSRGSGEQSANSIERTEEDRRTTEEELRREARGRGAEGVVKSRRYRRDWRYRNRNIQ